MSTHTLRLSGWQTHANPLIFQHFYRKRTGADLRPAVDVCRRLQAGEAVDIVLPADAVARQLGVDALKWNAVRRAGLVDPITGAAERIPLPPSRRPPTCPRCGETASTECARCG